jgi:flavorubredoxin
MSLKIIHDKDVKITGQEKEYKYQERVTEFLDEYDEFFDQDHINKIVLWKLNRYSNINQSVMNKINAIEISGNELDESLTREILEELLTTKGFRLPMASTVLRFRNPEIYQILDQRVYRLIYGKPLRLSYSKGGIDEQIDLYLEYLRKLKQISDASDDFDFKEADQVLYMLDKRVNEEFNLKY